MLHHHQLKGLHRASFRLNEGNGLTGREQDGCPKGCALALRAKAGPSLQLLFRQRRGGFVLCSFGLQPLFISTSAAAAVPPQLPPPGPSPRGKPAALPAHAISAKPQRCQTRQARGCYCTQTDFRFKLLVIFPPPPPNLAQGHQPSGGGVWAPHRCQGGKGASCCLAPAACGTRPPSFTQPESL